MGLGDLTVYPGCAYSVAFGQQMVNQRLRRGSVSRRDISDAHSVGSLIPIEITPKMITSDDDRRQDVPNAGWGVIPVGSWSQHRSALAVVATLIEGCYFFEVA